MEAYCSMVLHLFFINKFDVGYESYLFAAPQRPELALGVCIAPQEKAIACQ